MLSDPALEVELSDHGFKNNFDFGFDHWLEQLNKPRYLFKTDSSPVV